MRDQLDELVEVSGLEDRECPACGGVRGFEVPPCADGHADACPERVCTGCGTALVLGPGPLGAARAPLARSGGRRRLAVVA